MSSGMQKYAQYGSIESDRAQSQISSIKGEAQIGRD